MSEQHWCERCGGVILPLASAAIVNGKPYHDTDLCSPLRIKDPVANAINHGENRYRQTVLSQGPLPGYPVIERTAPSADATAGMRFDFRDAYRSEVEKALARGLTQDAAHELGLFATYLVGKAKGRARSEQANATAREEKYKPNHRGRTLREAAAMSCPHCHGRGCAECR